VAPPDLNKLLEEGRKALLSDDHSGFGDVLGRLSEHATRMTDASADVIRAQLLYMADRYDEALEVCRQALTLNSDHPAIHELRAQIYFFRNQLDEAQQAAQRALETNPVGQIARTVLRHIERRRSRR